MAATAEAATQTRVGTVSEIWRFPVKSMQGEPVDAAAVTEAGVVGDRAYALVDSETGRVVSAKHPLKWPRVLACVARFTEEPVAGAEPPPVRIDLPDGTSVTSDATSASGTLSRFFGREVHLATAAPSDYTIEQYHPDLDYDPDHRNELVDQRLGAAFFDERGLPSAVPPESFFDLFPLSVLASSTLDRLRELRPSSDFDVRRFRMNLVIRTEAAGFVDNEWVGRRLKVGADVRLQVTMPDPRCVMPSLDQPNLGSDGDILRTLAAHNRLDIEGKRFPCAGVYAVALAPGGVQRDDEVHLV